MAIEISRTEIKMQIYRFTQGVCVMRRRGITGEERQLVVEWRGAIKCSRDSWSSDPLGLPFFPLYEVIFSMAKARLWYFPTTERSSSKASEWLTNKDTEYSADQQQWTEEGGEWGDKKNEDVIQRGSRGGGGGWGEDISILSGTDTVNTSTIETITKTEFKSMRLIRPVEAATGAIT